MKAIFKKLKSGILRGVDIGFSFDDMEDLRKAIETVTHLDLSEPCNYELIRLPRKNGGMSDTYVKLYTPENLQIKIASDAVLDYEHECMLIKKFITKIFSKYHIQETKFVKEIKGVYRLVKYYGSIDFYYNGYDSYKIVIRKAKDIGPSTKAHIVGTLFVHKNEKVTLSSVYGKQMNSGLYLQDTHAISIEDSHNRDKSESVSSASKIPEKYPTRYLTDQCNNKTGPVYIVHNENEPK